MEKYIHKELSLDCLMGPFLSPPWDKHVAVSPMSTRPKKLDHNNRRVLTDLSWPHDGTSVNDGIPTDKYLEQHISLTYPTVDLLCKKAFKLGKGCFGYKKDLIRAFKQIFIDPRDWPQLGISWRNFIYFDKTAVMGSRSAPYACQRTTTLIRHIMENIQYNLFNYVDDFMGLEASFKTANNGFRTLGFLLRDLGVGESLEKSVEPTQIIEFLGVLFNLLTLTISVTPEKMQEITSHLDKWQHKEYYTRNELEQLLGKLQFISNCVRPGRVLVLRLRNALRTLRYAAVRKLQ